jgi:hypothetical protein
MEGSAGRHGLFSGFSHAHWTSDQRSLGRDLVERARSLAGIKGYVTNIDPAVMDGPAVVAAHHDLCQVERSFRMTKSDLAARPVFHRLEDSIQAHLTIVFAALAVSREAQARAGLSINRVLKTGIRRTGARK